MNKNHVFTNNEIDLINLSKIIWVGKIKIILMTFVFFLTAFLYNNQLPKVNKISLDVNLQKQNEYKKLLSVYALLENDLSIYSENVLGSEENLNINYNLIKKDIFAKLRNELSDYDEFIASSIDIKKDELSKLSSKDQKIELLKYSQLLNIEGIKEDEFKLTLNLYWEDIDEGKNILINTLKLVDNNINKLILNDVLSSLSLKKKIDVSKDLRRLDFLLQQSLIAKELGFADNQLKSNNLTNSNVFNVNAADTAYYLRGHRAIDKEIELIRLNEYKSLEFIEKEIYDLLGDQNIDWLSYNRNYIILKSTDNKSLILISVLAGLFFGVFYVLFDNYFKSLSISKKRNK